MSGENRDRYLTIKEAVEVLRALNFNVNLSQMRRCATERRLPFFRFGKSLYISEAELIHSFRSMQVKAVRNMRVGGRSRLKGVVQD